MTDSRTDTETDGAHDWESSVAQRLHQNSEHGDFAAEACDCPALAARIIGLGFAPDFAVVNGRRLTPGDYRVKLDGHAIASHPVTLADALFLLPLYDDKYGDEDDVHIERRIWVEVPPSEWPTSASAAQ